MTLTFQRNRARELDAVYHFRFTGEEPCDATVTIRRGALKIDDGLVERADLIVRVDSRAWLQFVRKERGLASMLVSGKLRLKGPPKLLVAFGKCFP